MVFALSGDMSLGRLLGLGAVLVVCWGCGSAASTDSSNSGGGGARTVTSTGGNSGSSNTSGARTGGGDSGSHTGGAAGANTAGRDSAGASGSAGAPPVGRCRSVADCPLVTGPTVFGAQCLSPGQPTPAGSCGAPGWCGECNCPAQPPAAGGTNMPCRTSSECPAAKEGMKVASVCAQDLCTECVNDGDCPTSTPVCGSVGAPGVTLFRSCSQCRTDQDCGAATPHCLPEAGLGRCVACLSNQECARGVCTLGSCAPQCDATHACDAFSACAPSQRCEALTCTSNADCSMPNAECGTGHCQRRLCTTDRECDADASCVNGRCYEMLGSCYVNQAVP